MNKKLIPTIFLVCFLLIFIALFLIPENVYALALSTQIRSQTIVNTWKFVLSIVNIFAIGALLFIALVTILRLNIQDFNVRRLLPALVVGVIAANFSHLISRMFIDVASLLAEFFARGGTGPEISGASIMNAMGLDGIYGSPTFDNGLDTINKFVDVRGIGFIGAIILIIIIFLIALIMLGMTTFMLYARIYVLWFLVIVSPLAFFCAFFTPLQILWKKWWKEFICWLLLGPVVVFVLRIMVIVGNEIGSIVGTDPGDESISFIGRWVFGMAMLYLAFRTPGILCGQAIPKAWGAVGGFVAGFATGQGFWGKTGAGGALRADLMNRGYLRARGGRGLAGRALRRYEAAQGWMAGRAGRREDLAKAAASGPGRVLRWGSYGGTDKLANDEMISASQENGQRWGLGSQTPDDLYDKHMSNLSYDFDTKELFAAERDRRTGEITGARRASEAERYFFQSAYDALGVKAENAPDPESRQRARELMALARRRNGARDIFEITGDNRNLPMGRGGQLVPEPASFTDEFRRPWAPPGVGAGGAAARGVQAGTVQAALTPAQVDMHVQTAFSAGGVEVLEHRLGQSDALKHTFTTNMDAIKSRIGDKITATSGAERQKWQNALKNVDGVKIDADFDVNIATHIKEIDSKIKGGANVEGIKSDIEEALHNFSSNQVEAGKAIAVKLDPNLSQASIDEIRKKLTHKLTAVNAYAATATPGVKFEAILPKAKVWHRNEQYASRAKIDARIGALRQLISQAQAKGISTDEINSFNQIAHDQNSSEDDLTKAINNLKGRLGGS